MSFHPTAFGIGPTASIASLSGGGQSGHRHVLGPVLMLLLHSPLLANAADGLQEGETLKALVRAEQAGPNLLQADAWRAYEKGFLPEADALLCDNGSEATLRRGAVQTVELNQRVPEPIVASAWSKAQAVSGNRDSNYAVYLDLVYQDGTPLWGQAAPFEVGTHDWQQGQLVVLPEKPVKRVSFYLLLRGHSGRAWFRQPELRAISTPQGVVRFDGVPVVPQTKAEEGFQVRDVGAGGDFVRIGRQALDLKLHVQRSAQANAEFFDVELTDASGKDRAVTLLYAIPVKSQDAQWFDSLRLAISAQARPEHMWASAFGAGMGRLSRWPLAAVGAWRQGQALGIDMTQPAFFRVGYHSGTGELFLAYDLGLTPEKPSAKVRFCKFGFDPAWGLRGALAAYYELFPEHFRCRTPEQGLWMPFAKISAVRGWEDFGFKFKEGNNETAWDDKHGIITFRYTEPMTWWMKMPAEMPRTMEAALAEARRLADEKQDPRAKALLTSGYHNAQGQIPARLLDTPWCNGAVWSMNSMPGIAGEITDFKLKWNGELREQLYGPSRKNDLDGEYIDSSEGYVTDELDFRREHFAAARTPLCFSPGGHRPAIFRGLIAFEYVAGIAADMHGMGKLMMANGAPGRLCWLAPLLEVMGTETNWNRGGKWQPMSDNEMLFRRGLCRGKPYCFLMNTVFEEFSSELVEKYMKRSLAYGMFPGFFSHNASQGHYFTRPELYDRDRPLFQRYVPLCKRVAEAGWEPVTLARSSDERVYVERFGQRYLTVLNDSDQPRTATIHLDGLRAAAGQDLVTGRRIDFNEGRATLTLEPEDVALIEVTRQ